MTLVAKMLPCLQQPHPQRVKRHKRQRNKYPQRIEGVAACTAAGSAHKHTHARQPVKSGCDRTPTCHQPPRIMRDAPWAARTRDWAGWLFPFEQTKACWGGGTSLCWPHHRLQPSIHKGAYTLTCTSHCKDTWRTGTKPLRQRLQTRTRQPNQPSSKNGHSMNHLCSDPPAPSKHVCTQRMQLTYPLKRSDNQPRAAACCSSRCRCVCNTTCLQPWRSGQQERSSGQQQNTKAKVCSVCGHTCCV